MGFALCLSAQPLSGAVEYDFYTRRVSIATWITQWADTNRVAFHFEGQATTYAELAERIEIVAGALHAEGVCEGDRVGYCGLNRIELFELLFASARIGAIFVPFNNRLTSGEIAFQIENSDPAVLFATDGFDALMRTAAGARSVRDLDAEPITGRSSSLPAESDQRQATVLMVYTSGTTGQAKGAMMSHDAVVHTVLNSVDHQDLTQADRVVAPLPTFHVGGLTIQTLPTLFVGGTVMLQRRFDPAGVLALIAEHEATQTLLVPAMLAAVAGQPGFEDTDLSSLTGINTGSSIVPAEVMQPFFDRGIPVGQVYGTTETGPTAVVLRYEDAADHRGSCGTPARHSELRIVDGQGNDVTETDTGELWLRGPNIFTGYWNNPEATSHAFGPRGWFRTGDVGHRDRDGFVTISDRMTDVVISGGENVYPAEIEPVLAEHPAIAEVAVVGEASTQWGEVPVAVATLVEDATLSIDELRDWCEDRLARFKQPKLLRVVKTLPRTALGKVKKHELRTKAWSSSDDPGSS